MSRDWDYSRTVLARITIEKLGEDEGRRRRAPAVSSNFSSLAADWGQIRI